MICPKCKENKAHRSRRSGVKDWALALILRIPYRCRACGVRVYISKFGSGATGLRTSEERRVLQMRRALKLRRMKRELMAYGIGLVIMIGVLYYLFQQHIPTE